MSNSLVPQSPNDDLYPAIPNADELFRIGVFVEYLDSNRLRWLQCDLSDFLAYLRNDTDYALASIRSIMSTVRTRIQDIINTNHFRDDVMNALPDDMSMADRIAYVNEVVTRALNNINPRRTMVKGKTHRSKVDSQHIRLTYAQFEALCEAPIDYWQAIEASPKIRTDAIALRDSAIIALMGCTGIRADELCNLEVNNLYETIGGIPALHVIDGKGGVSRSVPYGALDWCLGYVEKWLDCFNITSGYVFRGFTSKYYNAIQDTSVSTASINNVLSRYEAIVDGKAIQVKPHDLRRSYASFCYHELGLPEGSLKQNLGHAKIETTFGYIGEINADDRAPKRS